MTGKRVLVCGGRDYADIETLWRALNALWPISVLIEGGAAGADRISNQWARAHSVETLRFHAKWYPDGYGGRIDKSAGPRRNQQMIDEGKPDIVLAAPGGKGTADMVRRARAAGIEVIEIKEGT